MDSNLILDWIRAEFAFWPHCSVEYETRDEINIEIHMGITQLTVQSDCERRAGLGDFNLE